MHTLEINDTTFHYNYDLSGGVEVTVEGTVMIIPGIHLVEFVLEAYIKSNLIAKIENLDLLDFTRMIE